MSARPAQLRRRSKPSLGSRLRRFWILALVALAAAAYAGVLLANAPAFRLAHLNVTGASRVPQDEIVARASLDPRANIWLLDVHAIERRVEAIPYVLAAHVHRSFPGGVSVDVVERVPEACLRDGGAAVTIDRALRVIAAGCAAAPPLAYVVNDRLDLTPGTFVNDAKVTQLQRDALTLASRGEQYKSFSLDPHGQLDALMANGIRVRFGDDDDLASKERLVGPILASLGPRAGSVRAVDLRAPGTPVVEFR